MSTGSIPTDPNTMGAYVFINTFTEKETATTINRVGQSVAQLVAKGEGEMGKLLDELAQIDPGELDQSRLMSAQMTMTRWQMAAQLLSNFQAGVATGLKNILQNIR